MSVTVTLTWLRSLTVVVKRDDLSHDFPLLIVLIAQGEVMLGRGVAYVHARTGCLASPLESIMQRKE